MLPASVSAGILLAAVLCPYAVFGYKIDRNTDDCIQPGVDQFSNSCDRANAYPKSNYWATGTAINRLPDGGTKITNQAGFSVTYYKTYKVVVNEKAKETYVLYHCGCSPPSNIPSGAKVYSIPLQSISADDTTVGEFMNQCAVLDRVAYVSELGINGCYQLMTQCGYGAPDPTTSDAVALSDQVDAFVTYGATSNTKSIAMSAVFAKTPLTRSEWLKYFAAFFNKEFESEPLYRQIRNNYNSLMRAATSASVPRKTVVAWTFKGWSSDFVISKASYKVAYVQNAGGVMVSDAVIKSIKSVDGGTFTKYDDGVSWSIPQVYTDAWAQLLSKVDVIIDESYSFATGCFVRLDDFVSAHSLSSYTRTIPAIANKNVYTIAGTASQTIQEGDYTGSVGLDWYERGTARADEVLKDFIAVVLPRNVWPAPVTSWSRKWLLRLNGAEQQKKVAKTCPIQTAQLDMNTCIRKVKYVQAICPNTVRNCTTGNFLNPLQSKRCDAVTAQKQTMRIRQRQGLPKCVVT